MNVVGLILGFTLYVEFEVSCACMVFTISLQQNTFIDNCNNS